MTGPGDSTRTRQVTDFQATVFVSSVNGFTARCNTFQAAEIATWVNGFFRQITEAVLAEGGMALKYMGDGFVAYFDGAAHELRAARAAVAARSTVTDELVVGLASGVLHRTKIGHSVYARTDILGATVNKAFRVNSWAATNAADRIAAALSGASGVENMFRVTNREAVALKGIAAPVDMLEIH